MVSDRSECIKPLKTVRERTKRPALGTERPASNTPDTSNVSSLFPFPSPYDGRADQRVFNTWEHQVKSWVKYHKLSDKEVMYTFSRLVSVKAESCFMLYVAPSRFLPPRRWTLNEILEVIHKECFPPGYKMTLHKRLMSATQGDLRVKEFAAELRSLAKRLPYVNEQCLAAIFFVGVHKYIQDQLIADGMGQGDTDLGTLVKYASRYEDARRMLRTL